MKLPARAWLLWASIVCPAVAIIAGLFARTWPVQRGLIFYIAPCSSSARCGSECAWASALCGGSLCGHSTLGVFALALLRFITGTWLPFSGHMLFLSYSGLTTASIPYRVLAFALALETAWFKFVLWRDQRTFWSGLAGGLVAALIYVLVQRRGSVTST